MLIVPQKTSGYAVVVSKKVARLSTTRHRLKRQILAAMRTLNLPKSLVVFPRASAVGLSFKAIQTELSQLLSKIYTHKQGNER